jgi:hypothetical protein
MQVEALSNVESLIWISSSLMRWRESSKLSNFKGEVKCRECVNADGSGGGVRGSNNPSP